MESLTYIKNLRMPPKKLRFYLDEIKKMTPNDSLKQLYYGKQRATRILYKAIKSAVANATTTLKTSADLLNFKVLTIEEGQTLKRYLPGSRGNAKPIKKHMSHIKIILVVKGAANAKKEVKKETEKVVETKKVEEPKKKNELKIKKQSETVKAKK